MGCRQCGSYLFMLTVRMWDPVAGTCLNLTSSNKLLIDSWCNSKSVRYVSNHGFKCLWRSLMCAACIWSSWQVKMCFQVVLRVCLFKHSDWREDCVLETVFCWVFQSWPRLILWRYQRVYRCRENDQKYPFLDIWQVVVSRVVESANFVNMVWENDLQPSNSHVPHINVLNMKRCCWYIVHFCVVQCSNPKHWPAKWQTLTKHDWQIECLSMRNVRHFDSYLFQFDLSKESFD